MFPNKIESIKVNVATNWDIYFDDICNAVAKKSKDPQTKLGCVIAATDNSILSTGFNGFCRGVNETLPERWGNRDTKYFFVEHAERNAIYNAAKHGTATSGSKAYIPVWPCVDCAKGLIQSGIYEINLNYHRIIVRNISLFERLSSEEYDKWLIERENIYLMLQEACVGVNIYKMEK